MAKYTYKKLMSHKDFLKVQARARALMRDGTDLVAIDYKDRMLYFKTRSATDRRIVWTQKIQITDALIENILAQKDFKSTEDLIKNSGLKCSCTCPAWLYWGFKFVGWKKGYGLEREYRVPRVRNPHQVESVCFTGEQRVLTSEGYKPIKDVQIGDLVYTSKGRLRPVTDKGVRVVNEIVSLRVGSSWIRCTKDHPFKVFHYKGKSNASISKFNPHELVWDTAEHLNRGDMLVTPKLKHDEYICVPAKEAFMCGLYAADGSLPVKKTKRAGRVSDGRFSVQGLYIAVCSDFKSSYERIFDSLGVSYKYKQDSNHGGIFTIYDDDVKLRCLKTCNFTNQNLKQSKTLVEEFLHWNAEAKWEFIRGFFLGDGTIVQGAGDNGSTTYITLFNTNVCMMSRMFLFLRERYRVNLKYYERKPFRAADGLMIHPQRMYYIRVTGKEALDLKLRLGDVVTMKGGYRKDLAFSNYNLKSYIVEGAEYTPKIIKEVRLTNTTQNVYSLSVYEDDTFLVEDVVVHNCKHLYLVLQLYPFWSKSLASKFKNWAEKKAGKDASLKPNSPINRFDRVRQSRQTNDEISQQVEEQISTELSE